MIIFGWRTRLKLHIHETAECPVCKDDRVFRVVSVRRWFTLFFIPVLPLNLVGTFVECTACGMSLKLDPADAAQYLTISQKAVR